MTQIKPLAFSGVLFTGLPCMSVSTYVLLGLGSEGLEISIVANRATGHKDTRVGDAEWMHGVGVHLTPDEVHILLNLGHPLSEHCKEFRYGRVGVQQNLPALVVTGVEEGEL